MPDTLDSDKAVEHFIALHEWLVDDNAPASLRSKDDPGPNHDTFDRIVAVLRAKWTAEEIPACRVCGAELSVQSMGGSRATEYAHSKPDDVTYDEWSYHYQCSKWTNRHPGDSSALALLDLMVAYRNESILERMTDAADGR